MYFRVINCVVIYLFIIFFCSLLNGWFVVFACVDKKKTDVNEELSPATNNKINLFIEHVKHLL